MNTIQIFIHMNILMINLAIMYVFNDEFTW